jgi:hypothetical protein
VQRTVNPSSKEKIILLRRQDGLRWGSKSEHRRKFKEMLFHFSHQSSNPPTPAMQSVCPMCRGVHVLGGMAYDVKKVTVEVGELRQL